jgi:cytochrome P450
MTTVEQLPDYPFEPFRGDLPDRLLRMVVNQPVSRVRLPDGRPVWLVAGHEEVCTVLADPRFSRLTPPPPPGYEGPRELNMDGTAHAHVRRLAGRAFTARRIEAYRPRVQHLVDALLDEMCASGPPADLVAALVAPLPVRVTCEVLGVPVEDRPRFFAWIADLNSVTGYGSDDLARSQAELRAYLGEQLAAKRLAPGDDLLTAWVTDQDAHDLTDAEIVELAMGVLLGGLEINATSTGLRALFLHPDQLAALRAAPERLGGAVEEILRYTTVSSMFRVQVAVEDVPLGGTLIRAGDSVMAIPWAANRDPTHFPDPNAFRIDRTPNPHLTFGFGPHFCLGAALGRMQVEVSIGALLRRFPALAPAIPLDRLPWRHDRVNGGIARFPVTW